MKLKIKDIGPSGRDVAWDLAAAELLPILGALKVECQGDGGEAHLKLNLSVMGDEVLGRGTLDGWFDVACGRCLNPARITLDNPAVTVTFVPMPPGQATDAAEWKLEDPDTYTFDGEEVDLEPLLRESLVLAIPIAPLCQDECRGLCSDCGVDLNVESCQCATAPAPGDSVGPTPWKAAVERIKTKGRGAS